ncbi:hypothetical protein BV20DRAFT_693172 [Pilatotrama ljubarskyi]|nr:hypothetical protein BV20DRAFT_693172 [Pilatotrama ljubarskyi]
MAMAIGGSLGFSGYLDALPGRLAVAARGPGAAQNSGFARSLAALAVKAGPGREPGGEGGYVVTVRLRAVAHPTRGALRLVQYGSLCTTSSARRGVCRKPMGDCSRHDVVLCCGGQRTSPELWVYAVVWVVGGIDGEHVSPFDGIPIVDLGLHTVRRRSKLHAAPRCCP